MLYYLNPMFAFDLSILSEEEKKSNPFLNNIKDCGTIKKTQNTVNRDGEEIKLSGKGRHDPCVLPRAIPIVEAMVALVLADHSLRQRTSRL